MHFFPQKWLLLPSSQFSRKQNLLVSHTSLTIITSYFSVDMPKGPSLAQSLSTCSPWDRV